MCTTINAVNIPIQKVPQHLRKKGKSKLLGNTSDLFNVCNLQLLFHGKTVEIISTKDQRILRGVDSMNPPRWNEKGVSGGQLYSAASLYQVTEESLRLLARQNPLLVSLQVVICWWYQEKYLQKTNKIKKIERNHLQKRGIRYTFSPLSTWYQTEVPPKSI